MLPPLKRLLSRPVCPRGKRLPPPLPIPGSVDNHPLALPHSPEGRLVGDQLQRIDRLPPFADQQPVIVLALNGCRNPPIVLEDLDLPIEVKLVEHLLDKLPNPLGGLRRPIRDLTHSASSLCAELLARRESRR